MKCKKHPRYKAIRRPTVTCLTCEKMFVAAQKKKLRQAHEALLEYRKTLFKKKQNRKEKET